MDRRGVLLSILGFVALGTAPSWMDWRDHPESQHLILLHYLIGIILITAGLKE